MSDSVFIDTNVWIYFFTKPENEVDKNKRSEARELIQSSRIFSISIQILNEISNILFKKYGFTPDSLLKIISEVSSIASVYPFSMSTHIIKKYSLSYFDALVVASALSAGCDILYSEDMQHGLKVKGKLEIINPFS